MNFSTAAITYQERFLLEKQQSLKNIKYIFEQNTTMNQHLLSKTIQNSGNTKHWSNVAYVLCYEIFERT